MRNYHELTEAEEQELERLYPVTPNALLSQQFQISVDAINVHFVRPLGWKKDHAAIKLATRGKYHQLTEREEQWIVRHYATTKNQDIMAKYNISTSQLNAVRKRHGLQKSPRMMKKWRREASEACSRAFRDHGEGEAAAERARQQWAERKATGDYGNVGFKKGMSNKTRMSPAKYRKVQEKINATRAELIRRDRIRIHFGLEPKSKLVKHWDGKRNWRKYHYRHLMPKKHGYIVLEKGADTIYYDDQTTRSPMMEQNARKCGLRICELPPEYRQESATQEEHQPEEHQQENHQPEAE